MTEGENTRLISWAHELRAVHERLREALDLTRAAVADRADTTATRELLLFCRGFCTALTRHHEGEDAVLFPAIQAAHPELAPVLAKLAQDQSMIGYLIGALEAARRNGGSPAEVGRHLDGLAAIMESHFRYEERQLLTVLERLALVDDPRRVLGPL